MPAEEHATLYHVTARANLVSIAERGLRDGGYWASNTDLVDYYAETVEDEGEEPAVLVISLKDLLALVSAGAVTLEPDHAGIAEPITSAIGMSEEDVIEAWDEAEGTWEDSLDIVGSLRAIGNVPADLLLLDEDDDPRPLREAVSGLSL